MTRRQLRVFYGPHAGETVIPNEQCLQSTAANPEIETARTITLPLSDIVESLADAVNNERTWLSDFSDEPICIPVDLHQVIMAYAEEQKLQRYRPSA